MALTYIEQQREFLKANVCPGRWVFQVDLRLHRCEHGMEYTVELVRGNFAFKSVNWQQIKRLHDRRAYGKRGPDNGHSIPNP